MLDLYIRSGRTRLDETRPEVIALSQLLDRLPVHPPSARVESFRTPNAVALKLANFRWLDPAVEGATSSRHDRVEQVIWSEFADNPQALSAAAGGIAALIDSNAPGATVNRWWLGNPRQRFWVEVTSRRDIGNDLRAPQADESGSWYWGYGLINEIGPGDVVLHYDQNAEAFVAMSRAVGSVWSADIRWAARGTSARAKGIEPHNRPGWYLGLEAFTRLPAHVGKDELEEHRTQLVALRDTLQKVGGEPVYFPLILYANGRPISPQQAYLTKCPVEMLQLLPGLAPVLRFGDLAGQRPAATPDHRVTQPVSAVSDPTAQNGEPSQVSGWGSEYRDADEDAAVSKRDPFAVDPTHVERSLRGHASTQNALAAWVRSRGHLPRSPSPRDPLFDLAWEANETLWVAEVKSLTDANEEKQLRLALGQVLRYRHLLRGLHAQVIAVIAVERAPKDRTWIHLCADQGVHLVWPGYFDELAVIA